MRILPQSLVAAMVVLGCGTERAVIHEMNGDLTRILAWDRIRPVPSDTLDFELREGRGLHLPDELQGLYSLRDPVSVRAAERSGSCVIYVADAGDIAVHEFDASTLRYRRSVFLGGRDSSVALSLDAFDVAANGSWLIADGRRGDLVLVEPDGQVTRRWSTIGEGATVGVARHAALVGSDLVVERATALPDSAERLPPTRVWNTDGRLVRSLGVVDSVAYIPFSRALSERKISVFADTVWTANVVSATVEGYIARMDSRQAVEVIELDVYHQLARPRHAVRAVAALGDLAGGMLPVEIGRHVSAFAVDGAGNFVLALTTRNGGSVLQVVRRDGRIVYEEAAPGRVDGISVLGRRAAISFSEPQVVRGRATTVVTVDLPVGAASTSEVECGN